MKKYINRILYIIFFSIFFTPSAHPHLPTICTTAQLFDELKTAIPADHVCYKKLATLLKQQSDQGTINKSNLITLKISLQREALTHANSLDIQTYMAQVLHLITDCYDIQPNQQDLATCSICQENLPSNYIILTCGHAFCYECLFQWFMQHDIRKSESASTKCPNCRQELARHVKYIFTTDKRFKKKSLNRLEEIKKEEAETLAQLQQQALESLPALQAIMTLIGTLHESGMFSDSTNNTYHIRTQRTNNRTNYT